MTDLCNAKYHAHHKNSIPHLFEVYRQHIGVTLLKWRSSTQRVSNRIIPNKSASILKQINFNGLLLSSPDINECKDSTFCQNGRCANVPGSYRCDKCDSGYELSINDKNCTGMFMGDISHTIGNFGECDISYFYTTNYNNCNQTKTS